MRRPLGPPCRKSAKTRNASAPVPVALRRVSRAHLIAHGMSADDEERNRLSGRLARYARVGTGVGGFAARAIGSRALGRDFDRDAQAVELARMLGGLKGPIMKVAQLAATVPDVLPPEYAVELQKLQAEAPPMGWAFVRRRMRAELGPDWEKRFRAFEHEPAAAASLGQVHRADRAGRARRLPASCNTRTCSRRSKPISASSA